MTVVRGLRSCTKMLCPMLHLFLSLTQCYQILSNFASNCLYWKPNLLIVSEITMSQEDSEARNVHKTENNGDIPHNDGDVFDFFKNTEHGVKFKKFLTPITESNMLLYIKIKSIERKNYRSR